MNEKTSKIFGMRKPYKIAAVCLIVFVAFLIWLIYFSGIGGSAVNVNDYEYLNTPLTAWTSSARMTDASELSCCGLTIKTGSRLPLDDEPNTYYGLYEGESFSVKFYEPYNAKGEQGDSFDAIAADASILAEKTGKSKITSVYDFYRFNYGLTADDCPPSGDSTEKIFYFLAQEKNDSFSKYIYYHIETRKAKGFVTFKKEDKCTAKVELYPNDNPDMCYSVTITSKTSEITAAMINSVDISG